MTKLLDRAFNEASKLSEMEQNALAHWLMDEIISEKEWDKAFAESVEKRMGKGGPFANMKGFAAKAASNALRIAGVLQYIQGIAAGALDMGDGTGEKIPGMIFWTFTIILP